MPLLVLTIGDFTVTRSCDEGAALAQSLDHIFKNYRRMTFAQLKSAYQQLLAEFLAEEQTLLLEAKRRVAERILMTAIVKQMPVRTCMRHFGEVQRLGFTDMVQECSYRIILCRHLVANDAKRQAARMLTELRRKCDAIKGPRRKELADVKKPIDDILKQCEA